MKKSLSHGLVWGALALGLSPAVSPASAQTVACGIYQPGLVAFVTRTRPAVCPYQGDYMVNQGPTYSGPARMAPQPTYAPTPTVRGYVHGDYRVAAPVVRRKVVTRKREVNVKSDLPAGRGKPQVVRANAVVRIYGPERMDIRLYRR